MTPVPTAIPLAAGVIMPRVLPVHDVHLAVMRFDADRCRYLAMSGLGTWSAEVHTRWPRVAAIDALRALRSSISSDVSIRVVADIERPRPTPGHVRELEACFPRVRLESAHAADHRPLELVSSALRKWLRRAAATLPAIVVATDGSVKGAAIGSAWLAANGEYGSLGRVDRSRHPHIRRVLIAELEAAAAAVDAIPNRRLDVLMDCRDALDVIAAWRRGGPGPAWLSAASPDISAFRRAVASDRGRLAFRWVPGHDGMLLNEGADSLSKIARRRAERVVTTSDARRRSADIAAAFAPQALVPEAS
ncbi:MULTISPECIES: RNase H family protein [Gordonia]|uniref:RNase H family protein n=1 Tax=Gordonia TaxID=2053 RepID=UPI0030FEF1A8